MIMFQQLHEENKGLKSLTILMLMYELISSEDVHFVDQLLYEEHADVLILL